MAKETLLITEPIPQLIRRIGIPVAIGVVFNTLFQVVDTFFAGMISKEALAALALSFPIFFIIIGIASGMASGTSALIGNVLGSGDQQQAEYIAVQGLVLTVVLSFISMWLGLVSSPFLFRILGATDSYLAINLSYITPIFKAAPFFNLVYMFNATLTAQGQTKPFRNFLILGFFLNILFDPWFIFGGLGIPPLGIRGVAIATILIQFVGALYLGYIALRTSLFTARAWRLLIPNLEMMSQIIRQGLPTAIDLSTISVGGFVVMYFISQFGTEAVAAYGVASRLIRLISLPLVGLDVATLSLVAQNNGANRHDRVRKTFNTAIRYGLLLIITSGVLMVGLARPLLHLFTTDGQIIDMGINYIWISAVELPMSPFVFVGFAALRGVKRPLLPMTMSISRMIVLPAIIMYLFTIYLGMGLHSIWWGLVGINIATGAITWFAVTRLLPRNNHEGQLIT